MLNRITIMGRLTRTPELRYSLDGVPTASFRLANETDRKNANGNRITTFVDCVMWRQNAILASEQLRRGSLAGIDGTITNRSFITKDGTRRTINEIEVERFYLLD